MKVVANAVLVGVIFLGFGTRAHAQEIQWVTHVAVGDVEWSGTNLELFRLDHHGQRGENPYRARLSRGGRCLRQPGDALVGRRSTCRHLPYTHCVRRGPPLRIPLDPDIIKEDIARVRDEVDHVVLSFHWLIYHFDVSRSSELHPMAVEFAREMIDAGADVILGHHPHVPRAIEVYRGRPIYYSMGHLIFSFELPQWGDTYMPRVYFSKGRVERVELLPVAGRSEELAQPFRTEGDRARALLDKLQSLSNYLGTTITTDGDAGVLEIERDAPEGPPWRAPLRRGPVTLGRAGRSRTDRSAS